MKLTGSVVAIILAVIFLTACNSNEHKSTSPTKAESTAERKPVEFTKPAMIIIQNQEDNYRLPNSKKLESLIIKANQQSIEIAIMPASDLRFIKTHGEDILLDQKALNGTRLILFNGTEILLTTPEADLNELFDVFYKTVSPQHTDDYQGISPQHADGYQTGSNENRSNTKTSGKNKTKRKATQHSKSLTEAQEENEEHSNSNNHINSLKERKASNITGEHPTTNIDIYPVIVTNPVLNSYLWPYSNISVTLDNDLFSNTDRYYTNGVRIRYSSPSLAFWRINSILPVSRKGSMEYNSIELNHEMYTPFTTKLPPILKDDRPYASALYIRFVRKSGNPDKDLEQQASVDIGVIGKASLGGLLQRGVHAGIPDNDEPLGWETQIANDLILNYNYELTKLLHTEGNFHTYTVTSASLGTFNTSASTGIGFSLGTSPYFISPLPENFNALDGQQKRKWTYTLNAVITSSVVGYNATLSGGILNKNNIYVLEPRKIERLLFKAEAGFTLNYQNFGLRIAQHYTTNEFKKGKHHFWGEIGLTTGL